MRDSFDGAGVDNFTQPPAQDQSLFTQLTNILPSMAGTLQRRWGYKLLNSLAAAYNHLFPYRNDNTGARKLVATSATAITSLNEDGSTSTSSIFTPSGGASDVYAVNSRGYMYFADGVAGDLKKWDGTTVSLTGIVAPAIQMAVGTPNPASNITLNFGRKYYLVFENTTSGNFSDLSPVSITTGPLASQSIPLTAIAVSADSQVDKKRILATNDGGDETLLYEVTQLANATTTYTDTMDELTLLSQNVYQQTDASGNSIGVADNSPPPNGLFPTKHRGRIYMAVGQSIYFSKSIDELTPATGNICGRYEECWPATYFLDTSESTAESFKGFLSDGNTLYIGTERKIYRLDGDGPNSFSSPFALFNEVGVINQDSWKIVFNEGQPIGMMWLTPDLRVMLSNGNTYSEIGTPVHATLATVNAAYAAKAVATSVTLGPFSFYMLAVPTGISTVNDTILVYDLRMQRWYVWKLADSPTAVLYNVNSTGTPQALFISSTGKLYQLDPAFAQDRVANTPVNITSTIQTSWLHMGEPTRRKVLNELEIITGDTSATVSLDAASLATDFASPISVVSGAALPTSPLGPLKLMLGGQTTKHRYYRLTLSSTSVVPEVLDGFSFEFYPLHHI